MDDAKYILSIRNFISVIFIHFLFIFFTLLMIGVSIAYITNGLNLLNFDLTFIKIIYQWDIWLKDNWENLPYSSYDYLKLKLILSNVCPLTVMGTIYYLSFDYITDWHPFKENEKTFGNAAWATDEDIKRAKLTSKNGMLLGQGKNNYFVSDGFQHALLFAPTGSGKGVGFVIPNLLFWEDSVVVHDIKLENYELTSGWRAQQGQDVFVWEPSNPDGITHCYNPLDWVSTKPGQMVDDVQKISNLILPEKDFWNNEARSLFVGVVLYLIADETKPKTFGEVVRTMRSDDVVYNLSVVLDTLGKAIHPVSYMNLAAFLQKADKERSGVISTLNSSLELWANPLIDSATSKSDFNIQEFKKKKTTVYVGLTPDNINRLQRLMQIFYQQATEFLSRKIPNVKDEPYGVMFLMDEFPTLGKMEQFKSGIAYFRGYRVRLFLIIQDTQQLKGIYEEAGMNSFLSNSTFRITFAANNIETANLISQLCGNKTVKQASLSRPKFLDFNMSINSSNKTESVSEVQRALLLPQEVIQLPRDEQIVLIESFPPIKSKKIAYYTDKFFTDRLLKATIVPTQKPYTIHSSDEDEYAEDNEDSELDHDLDQYQTDDGQDADEEDSELNQLAEGVEEDDDSNSNIIDGNELNQESDDQQIEDLQTEEQNNEFAQADEVDITSDNQTEEMNADVDQNKEKDQESELSNENIIDQEKAIDLEAVLANIDIETSSQQSTKQDKDSNELDLELPKQNDQNVKIGKKRQDKK